MITNKYSWDSLLTEKRQDDNIKSDNINCHFNSYDIPQYELPSLQVTFKVYSTPLPPSKLPPYEYVENRVTQSYKLSITDIPSCEYSQNTCCQGFKRLSNFLPVIFIFTKWFVQWCTTDCTYHNSLVFSLAVNDVTLSMQIWIHGGTWSHFEYYLITKEFPKICSYIWWMKCIHSMTFSWEF